MSCLIGWGKVEFVHGNGVEYYYFVPRYIQHPNILSLLGAVEEGDTILIISNLVQGPNLHDLIFSGDYGKV